MLELAVDGVYCEYGVFADVAVAMLETRTAGGDERFEQLGLLGNLLQEPEGRAADVFIGMLLVPASENEKRRMGECLPDHSEWHC